MYDTLVNVDAPQVFGVDFNVVQPTCFGDEDGIIDVNIFSPGGGTTFTPPVSYDWNDMGTGGLRIGIGDGIYQVTISDIQGCQFISDSIEIAAPDALNLAIEGIGNHPLSRRYDRLYRSKPERGCSTLYLQLGRAKYYY